MARKPNYDFEKRRKELDRKAKKEAKAQRKLDNATRTSDDAPAEGAEPLSDEESTRTPE